MVYYISKSDKEIIMMSKKLKAVTFSYDDGVTQDQRLIALFNKYGLKSTFNINSEKFSEAAYLIRNDVTVSHVKPRACEIKDIYAGHEVAAHTLTHPYLPNIPDEEVIRQVEQDRLNLSDIVGYEVVGMAYPGGGMNHNEHVAQLIRENTGVKYARTIISTHNYDIQPDLYTFKPTVYHHEEFDKMFELGKQFLELETDKPQILYIWGHAYEFDIYKERWAQMEEFCRMISGRDDIFYGTNKEVLLENYWEK